MKQRRALIEANITPSMRHQCELLWVNRSSVHYEPVGSDAEELALMREIDALHLKHPFYGSRKIPQTLKTKGTVINRKPTQRLMRLMGLESVAPKPNTSKPAPEHPVCSAASRFSASLRPRCAGRLRRPGPGLQPALQGSTNKNFHPADSTLAKPVFGPKNGVHLRSPKETTTNPNRARSRIRRTSQDNLTRRLPQGICRVTHQVWH